MIQSQPAKRGKNRVGAAIGIILCIVLIPLLVVNVTLIVKSFVYPDKIPDFMGYKPFIVLSGSMEPAIMTGDLVITAKADTEDLKAGDVIAYRYGKETVITHRIQEVSLEGDRRAFITKGDANNVEDNVMPTEDLVEGKLRWTVPGVGNVAMFLQTPYVSFTLPEGAEPEDYRIVAVDLADGTISYPEMVLVTAGDSVYIQGNVLNGSICFLTLK